MNPLNLYTIWSGPNAPRPPIGSKMRLNLTPRKGKGSHSRKNVFWASKISYQWNMRYCTGHGSNTKTNMIQYPRYVNLTLLSHLMDYPTESYSNASTLIDPLPLINFSSYIGHLYRTYGQENSALSRYAKNLENIEAKYISLTR